MGRFSQRAITTGDSRSHRRADGCDILSVDPLQLHLDHLYAVYDELTSICPKDVLHPMYDCRFYADHITEQYEMPMTIQGVLRAIEAVTGNCVRQNGTVLWRPFWIPAQRQMGRS